MTDTDTKTIKTNAATVEMSEDDKNNINKIELLVLKLT